MIQVGSQKGGLKGENHFPQPAGYHHFDAAQYKIGLCDIKEHLGIRSEYTAGSKYTLEQFSGP